MGKKIQKDSTKKDENVEEKPTFSKELLLEDQKNLEAMCEKAEKDGCLQKFTKIKYKQVIYEIGDFIHLFDATNENPYVVRLNSILKIPQQESINAVLKVEWLMRKADLPAKFSAMVQHFSTAEVFPSGQLDYVYVESIFRKCNVLTYSEYEYPKNQGDDRLG